MRKSVYLLGGMSAFLILISALFKAQHWTGANELLIASVISGLLFIPLLLLFQLKRQSVYLLGGIAAFLMLIASLFNLQHWIYSNELLLLSYGSIAVFILVLIMFQFKRRIARF